jgi:hypothetical protein
MSLLPGAKMKNQRLEELSDLVRKGIPVDLVDAIAVINYQSELQEQREVPFLTKVKRSLGKIWTR